MTDQHYRLRVELHVQSHGQPTDVSFFEGSGHPGFPGVRIPLELLGLLDRLQGSMLQLPDPATDAARAGQRIREHFEAVAGLEGPPGHRWALTNEAWTIEDHVRWLPGYDAVAFQLGKQEVSPIEPMLTESKPQAFADTYELTSPDGGTAVAAATISAEFWVCFHLESVS